MPLVGDRKVTLILLLILFSLLVALPNTEIARAAEDSWEILSNLPTGILGPGGVAAVNGKIYVIGGTNENGYLNTNEEYDPATDTWTRKRSMPTLRSGFAIAVYQNKIYVIGGGGDFGFEEVTGKNEMYDPLTDTWETKAPMPTARQFMDANVVDGKIYVIGGGKPINFNNPSYVPNINEVYDPETNIWSTSIAPPVKVSNYASAVYGNKIYVFSKYLTQIYDTQTYSWTNGTLMPSPGWGAAAAVTTGVYAPKRIYVLGGNPTFPLNQIYDPETDTWTKGAQMPTGGYDLGVAVVDDVIYAMGGPGADGMVANERYTPFGFGTEPPTISIVTPENKRYAANNVSLTFTVNELTSWIGYSLDGEANVTLTGNTTLTGLSYGSHRLTVYANDTAGNTGTSETINFSIIEPFPTTWVVTAIAIIAIGGVAFLVYFRKIKKTTKTTIRSLNPLKSPSLRYQM